MDYYRLNYLAVVLVCLTVGTAEGQSLGRWRMPSTPAQFFGYGYGPGHHAPMVRMPSCTPQSVQRLDVVYPRSCQGHSGCGSAAQPCAYRIAPAPQPFYGGEGAVMQPLQSCPCNYSHDLFSAPANPVAPTAQPLEFPAVPSEPTTELLTTPEN